MKGRAWLIMNAGHFDSFEGEPRQFDTDRSIGLPRGCIRARLGGYGCIPPGFGSRSCQIRLLASDQGQNDREQSDKERRNGGYFVAPFMDERAKITEGKADPVGGAIVAAMRARKNVAGNVPL